MAPSFTLHRKKGCFLITAFTGAYAVRWLWVKFASYVTPSIKQNFQGVSDLANDAAVGFQIVTTDDIDDLGIPEVIKRIKNRIGDRPVYLR